MRSNTSPIRGIQAVRADASEAVKVLADLQKTFHDFKAENDKQIADLRKGQADPLQTAKVEAMNTAMTEMQAQMADLAVKASAFEMGGGAKTDKAVEAHKKGFDAFFRKGVDSGLRDLEIQARLTTQSDPDGGFVVPSEMEAGIDRILGKVSAVRSMATVRQIGAASYKKLVNLGGASSGWVGETSARPETGTPKLTALDFPAMELYAQPGATQTMLDDGTMNIESWLADEVSIEFAEQEGAAFVGGDGVAKPRGILAYPVVANASYAWGKVGFIKSGASGGFVTPSASASPADALIDLYFALKAGYRSGASWLMSDATMSTVRKFKDADGQYIWSPPTAAAEVATILGKPVQTDDNMPVATTNGNLAIAFGDFKRAYVVVDRVGIRVLRDPFTSKPNVLFYTTKRVGGGIQNFEAIKVLQINN